MVFWCQQTSCTGFYEPSMIPNKPSMITNLTPPYNKYITYLTINSKSIYLITDSHLLGSENTLENCMGNRPTCCCAVKSGV